MFSIGCEKGWGIVYVGLMEAIFLPSLLFTNSLLIKRPVGWEYFVPLGAVRSRKRSDILKFVVVKALWNRSLEGDVVKKTLGRAAGFRVLVAIYKALRS